MAYADLQPSVDLLKRWPLSSIRVPAILHELLEALWHACRHIWPASHQDFEEHLQSQLSTSIDSASKIRHF